MRNKRISKKGMSTIQGAVLAVFVLAVILFLTLPRQLQAKEGILLSIFNLVDNEEKSEASELVPTEFQNNAYVYIYAEASTVGQKHNKVVGSLTENSGIFNSFDDFEPKSSKCTMPDQYPETLNPDGCLIFAYDIDSKECAVNLYDSVLNGPVLEVMNILVYHDRLQRLQNMCITGYSCHENALEILGFFYAHGLDDQESSDYLDKLFKGGLMCISSEENAYLWLRCDKGVEGKTIEDYASKTSFECTCHEHYGCFWKTS